MGKKKNKRKGAFYSDDQDGKENPQGRGKPKEENNALEKQKQSKSRGKSGFHESKTWTSTATGRGFAKSQLSKRGTKKAGQATRQSNG